MIQHGTCQRKRTDVDVDVDVDVSARAKRRDVDVDVDDVDVLTNEWARVFMNANASREKPPNGGKLYGKMEVRAMAFRWHSNGILRHSEQNYGIQP